MSGVTGPEGKTGRREGEGGRGKNKPDAVLRMVPSIYPPPSTCYPTTGGGWDFVERYLTVTGGGWKPCVALSLGWIWRRSRAYGGHWRIYGYAAVFVFAA